MCTVDDLVTDIRRALNECEESTGCTCNARWINAEIIRFINDAIKKIANLRKDEFTVVSEQELGSGCWHDICALGWCEEFVKINYSLLDPCYIPDVSCEADISESSLITNPCLEFDTDALEDSTVLTWFHDKKNPCMLFIDREDDTATTEVSITCYATPDDVVSGDDLPAKICNKYRSYIFNNVMHHLLARDHNDTPQYIQLLSFYKETERTIMMDYIQMDGLYAEKDKFLGKEYLEDCD